MVNANQQRPVSRRRVLQSGAVVSGMAVTGCLGGGGENTLTYISRGGVTQEAERQVMDQWAEENGMQISHQSAADDTEIMELIANNPGAFDFTNLVPSAFAQHSLVYDEELFAELDYGEVPNYDNIKESWKNAPFLEGHDYGLFYYNNSQGIAYNTEHVEPTSWEDLKGSEYNGVLSMHNNATTRFCNNCAMMGISPSEALSDDETFQSVWDEQRDFHDNIFKYWAAGDEFPRLLREEQAHAVEGWGGRTENLVDDGLPMDYVIPEEGCLTYSTGWVMIDESDNKDDVYDLFNYMYERENAVELTLGHGYPVQLKDPPEEITNRYDYTESADDVIWLDWGSIIPAQSDLEQAFAELKGE